MLNDDKNLLKETLNEILDERFGLEDVRHKDDHNWIKEQREAQEKRAAMYSKLRVTALGALVTGIVSLLVSALYWVGTYAIEHLTFR